VLLDVGPQLLDALGPGCLLLSDDVGQLGAELHGLGQTGSLRHGDDVCVVRSGVREIRACKKE